MGSKACIVILVMGIIGIVSMGLLTNFALSSAPQLKHAIEFKAALAKDLGPSVEEVSVRRVPKQGYQVLLTVAPAGDTAPADLRVARFFASNHPDTAAARLEVARAAPVTFGCGSPRVYSTREFALPSVRNEIALEARREKLSKGVGTVPGCRLLAESRKGSTARLEVEAPAGAGPDLAGIARRIEPALRTELRTPPYTALEIRVSEASGGTPPVELRFDPRGRELRAPSGGPPGGPGAPGGGSAPGPGRAPGGTPEPGPAPGAPAGSSG